MVSSVAGSTRRDSRPDPAVLQARRVVGLYGDPGVSWSILLELDLVEPVEPGEVERRAGELARAHPHLGRVPIVCVDPPSWAGVRARFADEPFGDHEPLLRVAVATGVPRLLVAAHHGVVDGLGLVGVAASLVGVPLGSNARGVARTGSEVGFVRGTVARLGEVLLRPPERFASGTRLRAAGAGDVLVVADLPALRRGTSALVWAALATLRSWNGPPRPRREPVAAIGVSRRTGAAPVAPVRDTAFTRLHLGGVTSPARVAEVLAGTAPEPDFPETEGGALGRGVGRLASTALGPRLGSSFLASNLGLLAPQGAVRAARFWPSASGPAGVAFGLATVAGTTSLTARVRRPWFDDGSAARLLRLAQEALAADQ